MNNESETGSIILVVEDVNETRDGIEKLLKADGNRVTLAPLNIGAAVVCWTTKVS